MPAGVLSGERRHTIPLTDQGAVGGRVPGVPLEGPIVAPRRQIFLPDVPLISPSGMAGKVCHPYMDKNPKMDS